MKNVLVIEDEPPARDLLERQLARLAPELTIVASLASCAEAQAFLAAKPNIDLIICDIQLTDGSALELFTSQPAPAPIVFCTAFDRYVLEALDVGGVDYLLKPVSDTRLTKALDKLRGIEKQFSQRSTQEAIETALKTIATKHATRPVRFMVKRGADFVSVRSEDVAYFSSEHKLTLLTQTDGTTSYLDDSLS
nr:uncharacterized response regulatory protein VPA0021-like [Nerophis lumbriciformis]